MTDHKLTGSIKLHGKAEDPATRTPAAVEPVADTMATTEASAAGAPPEAPIDHSDVPQSSMPLTLLPEPVLASSTMEAIVDKKSTTEPKASRLDLSKLGAPAQLDLQSYTCEVKMYTNHLGWIVQEHVLMTGVFPPGYPRFKGMCEHKFTVRGPTGHAVVPAPIQFDIVGADSVADAWAFFGAIEQAEAIKMEPEIKKRFERRTPGIALPGQPGRRI